MYFHSVFATNGNGLYKMAQLNKFCVLPILTTHSIKWWVLIVLQNNQPSYESRLRLRIPSSDFDRGKFAQLTVEMHADNQMFLFKK